MANTKYLDLAKKLAALAKQGEGGEAINAQKMLERVMAEYGINPEDIDDSHVRRYWLRFEHQFGPLFIQVVSSVLGSKWGNFKKAGRETNSKTRQRGIDCTVAQYVEIEWKLKVYCEAYLDELKVMQLAFYKKHRLFANDEGGSVSWEDMSPEERELHRRSSRMADTLKDRQIQKQIERQ